MGAEWGIKFVVRPFEVLWVLPDIIIFVLNFRPYTIEFRNLEPRDIEC